MITQSLTSLYTMATPSLSPVSDNDSSEHDLGSFATLSGGSPIISGGGYTNSLSNNNNGNLLPNQPPAPPSSTEGLCILPKDEGMNTPPNSKKPRGRPPGSKNKPKPPLIVKQDTDELLKPVLIEIPTGHDVVEAIIAFAHRRRVGISVLSGSGSLSEVTIRQNQSRSASFPLKGHFNMISLTGTYMSGSFPPLSTSNPICSSFVIYVSGNQNQLLGGVVAGKVVASGLVVVMASVFKKSEYHRVPFINGTVEEADEEDDAIYAAMISADAGEPNGITNNINNNNVIPMPNMSAFNVAPANSTPLLPHPIPSDMNVMQWNHFDNY